MIGLSIKEKNENAFQTIYGKSLQKMLDAVSDEERGNAFERYLRSKMNKLYVDLKRDTLLVITIGFIGINEQRRMLEEENRNIRYVVYEPDLPMFLTACCLEEYADLFENARMHFLFGGVENEEDWTICLKRVIQSYNFCHIQFLEYSEKGRNDAAIERFIEVVQKSYFLVSAYAKSRSEFREHPYNNQLYALSVLGNNHLFQDFLHAFPEKNIPVILVAAGPSLDKNVRCLKKIHNTALIVAVSHAVKRLEREDIVPHLISAVDAMPGSGFLEGNKERDYRLLISAFVAKEVQEKYNGKLIFHSFDPDVLPKDLVKQDDQFLADSGSVATDVFKLLIKGGFRTFILAGQDLAYDESGNTHTGGEREKWGVNDENPVYLEGIDGKQVLSRGDWAFFKDNFEEMIREHPEIRVIDATEGGALIRGTEIMPLEDAIHKYCNREYPIQEWFDSMDLMPRADGEKIRIWLKHTADVLKKKRDFIEEAVEVNDTIQKEWAAGNVTGEKSALLCQRYDFLYGEIMDNAELEILRRFCRADVQEYNEVAITLERDEDIFKKLEIEKTLFVSLAKKSEELYSCIVALTQSEA